MAARRSRASRSISRWISTASRWRSMSRRPTGMTARASSRCCISLPAAASRGQPWAISATGASGCPSRRGARHHHPTQRRRSRRNLHSGGDSLGRRALPGLDQPLPSVEHHLRADRGAPRRFHRDRLHLDPVPPPGPPCNPGNQRLTSTNSFSRLPTRWISMRATAIAQDSGLVNRSRTRAYAEACHRGDGVAGGGKCLGQLFMRSRKRGATAS